MKCSKCGLRIIGDCGGRCPRCREVFVDVEPAKRKVYNEGEAPGVCIE